jgi:cytoplasmic iron level regulating protein YaaA (DUF328/UPF0246 family)
VLLLLPPSEGKTAPAEGGPVELPALAFPELTKRRETLLDRLPRASLKALGLSRGQAAERERNAGLRTAPAAPAGEVYTGVLYERARLPELATDGRVLIASALWGFVRPSDRIPAYRLSMGARLARIPSLATWWRPALNDLIPDRGLIVDLRSAAYAAAWQPREATVVSVRAFLETGDGARRPVSHMAKRARGDVARALLLARDEPCTPEDVAAAAAASGLRAELAREGRKATLDVIDFP